MSSSPSSAAVLLSLTAALLLCRISAVHGEDVYLSHICGLSNHSSSASSPKINPNNLRTLLEALPDLAQKTGFYNSSAGAGKDAVYALGLCRGDVLENGCHDCLFNATKKIQELCAHNDTGIIWYDECQVRYSSENFFGRIDRMNKLNMVNEFSLSDKPGFGNGTEAFLLKLAHQASGSSLMYAAGDRNVCGFLRQYGLAQCSRDVSSVDCLKCLRASIDELKGCCLGSQGSRILTGTCNVRTEIYAFFDASNQASSL